MKTATGLTVLAIGAILLFAVHGHPGFLNLQVVGLVLIAGALASLSTRLRPGWPGRQAERMQTWLTAETHEVDGTRVPLEDILQAPVVPLPSPRLAPDSQPADSQPADSGPGGGWPGEPRSARDDEAVWDDVAVRDNVTVPGGRAGR